MSSKEFDVHQLAAYLHLTPEKVIKLASQTKLPGRRVGGEWRFSEAAIHHWLEQKIGVSTPSELTKVEELLDRSFQIQDYSGALVDFMASEAVAIPLMAKTRSSVVREMCQLAASTGLLWDVETMAEAVAAREELHPTALETGVAMLHPRRPQSSILAEPIIALGITSSPISFGNAAGYLTDIFFLICSTNDQVHLRLLARLSRLVSDNVWLTQLRSSTSPMEVLDLVRAGERELIAQQE